jgi:hypothetical protein
MTDTPKPKPKTTPIQRTPKPSTLLNHIEDYCKANELGQDDTIGNLINTIEQDIIAEAKRRG